MRSVQWQLRLLGTFSALAYIHRENEKTSVEVAGRSSLCVSCVYVHWLLVLMGHKNIIQNLCEWKIFGLNKEASCIWRIESNKELNDLIKNRNMLNRFLIVFDYFC